MHKVVDDFGLDRRHLDMLVKQRFGILANQRTLAFLADLGNHLPDILGVNELLFVFLVSGLTPWLLLGSDG